MTSSPLSNRFLASATLVAFAIFPLIVIALHIVQRGQYHPLSDAVSQLALGRAGWLMWIAFCSAGAGFLGLATLHRRLVERSRVAPVLLAVAGTMACVSAAFHADPESATRASLHDEIHQTASLITFVSVIIAMFISSRRFRLDPRWRSFARPTLIWAICTFAALILVASIGDNLFGLGQRIFIATWLTWAIAATVRARSLAVESEAVAVQSSDVVPA
jgi:hypothetical membrane protein